MQKRYDAIVVGSGFGGAVSAARLSEKGLRVLILERGPWWGQAGREAPATVRREYPRGMAFGKLLRNVRWSGGRKPREWLANADGLFEVHRFRALDVFGGSGVGGGSLVYTNMQVQPADEYFSAWPEALSGSALVPYFERVRNMLRPAPQLHPTPRLDTFRRAAGDRPVELPDLAIAQGDPDRPAAIVNAAGVRQITCNYCGECIVGCPTTAKTTLDLTYVPWALRHGAEVRAMAEVTRLEPSAGGGYSVYFLDRTTGEVASVKADRVLVCAGTLNTLRLLLRAKFVDKTLPNISPQLGARFCGNGDMGTLLLGAKSLENAGYGPSVGGLVRIQEKGRHGHLVAEGGIPGSALPAGNIYGRWLQKVAFLLAMGRDTPSGRVSLQGGELDVDYSRAHASERYDSIEALSVELAAAYRAAKVWPNMPAGAGANRIASVHPTGGAAVGMSAATGVIDHAGQVFGYPGLYVADGSIYPAPPGVPPSMTIAAFAERLAELID